MSNPKNVRNSAGKQRQGNTLKINLYAHSDRYTLIRTKANCKKKNRVRRIVTASLSNRNTDAQDVMNSNRKFDVSVDGTLPSHHNDSECLCFNSCCTNLSSQSTERKKISSSGCHFRRPGCQRLLKGPNTSCIKHECHSTLTTLGEIQNQNRALRS